MCILQLRNAKKVVEKDIISREDHEGLFDDLRRFAYNHDKTTMYILYVYGCFTVN